MLVMLSITVVLCALAVCGTAAVTRRLMDRLGLDPMAALLWFGLAERPHGPRPGRARDTVLAAPGRRRRGVAREARAPSRIRRRSAVRLP